MAKGGDRRQVSTFPRSLFFVPNSLTTISLWKGIEGVGVFGTETQRTHVNGRLDTHPHRVDIASIEPSFVTSASSSGLKPAKTNLREVPSGLQVILASVRMKVSGDEVDPVFSTERFPRGFQSQVQKQVLDYQGRYGFPGCLARGQSGGRKTGKKRGKKFRRDRDPMTPASEHNRFKTLTDSRWA